MLAYVRIAAFVCLVLLCSLTGTGAAKADLYVRPEIKSLTLAMFRFKGYTIDDNDAIDIFSMVTECPIFERYYTNDFKWREIQGLMRETIRKNVSTYPSGFYYDVPLRLSRYDFDEKLFHFGTRGSPQAANAFVIDIPPENYRCAGVDPQAAPTSFSFVLDRPIEMNGLALSKEDAEELIKHMNAAGNEERMIYARFYLRLKFVATAKRVENGKTLGAFSQTARGSTIRLDSVLDTIEYYEDQQRTKLIYRQVFDDTSRN